MSYVQEPLKTKECLSEVLLDSVLWQDTEAQVNDVFRVMWSVPGKALTSLCQSSVSLLPIVTAVQQKT